MRDPAHVVMHDVCDFWSITPHNRRSPFQKFKRKHHGQDDLQTEIAEVGHFVRAISSPRRKVNVIKSNHDNFLARHLVETDWKNDPLNAELNLATVKAVKSGDDRPRCSNTQSAFAIRRRTSHIFGRQRRSGRSITTITSMATMASTVRLEA